MTFGRGPGRYRTVRSEIAKLGKAETKPTPEAPVKAARMPVKMPLLLALVAAIAVLVGVQISRSRPVVVPLTEQTLSGEWELVALGKETVGTGESAVLAQRISLGGGRIQGETRLRSDTEAGTTNMPFPSESVRDVQMSPNGVQVIVTWDGTVQLNGKQILQLLVGKAAYRIEAAYDADGGTLTFDNDPILTIPGPCVYRPVRVPAKKMALAPVP